MSTQPQTDELSHAESKRPRRLKWLLIAFFVLLPFGLLLQGYIYFTVAGRSELHEAIEEADRQDPHWRWDDLTAKRRVLADEENSALVVLRVTGSATVRGSGLLPGIPSRAMADLVSAKATPPPTLLTQEQADAIRDEMTKAGPALAELRKVEKMLYGRYPLKLKMEDNYFAVDVHHVQTSRGAVSLLMYYSRLLAHENQPDEALAVCRTAVGVSRALGDEPFAVSMLVRVALRSVVLSMIERVLAQGESTESSLAEVQKLLEEEVKTPLLENALKGERALIHRFFEAYYAGRISTQELMRTIDLNEKITGIELVDRALNHFGFYVIGGPMPRNHAKVLRFHNRMIESAQRLPEDRLTEMNAIDEEISKSSPIPRMVLPAVVKMTEADLRHIAAMRCMIVCVAAERFRLQKGRWAEKLEELAPQFLSHIPVDPYAKKPMMMKRVADGVKIYSVGHNRKDDGGNLFGDANRTLVDTDFGFQVWDVEKRRQKP